MVKFKVNLIRDRVLAKPLRKALFWGVLVYLLLCGAGLAYLVHRDTSRFVDITGHYREMKAVEEQLMLSHPGSKDVISHLKEVKPLLVKNANILSGIDRGLDLDFNFASILLGIAKPLPKDCVLRSVGYKKKSGVLKFSVSTPVNKPTSRLAGQLIDIWKKDAELWRQLGDIRSEASSREYQAGRAVMIHRFEAKPGDGS